MAIGRFVVFMVAVVQSSSDQRDNKYQESNNYLVAEKFYAVWMANTFMLMMKKNFIMDRIERIGAVEVSRLAQLYLFLFIYLI